MIAVSKWTKSSFEGELHQALPDDRYPALPTYGLRLTDRCIDKVALPGMTLTCIDYSDARWKLLDGDLVIAEIQTGASTELTARRLRRAGNAWELHHEAFDGTDLPIVRFGGEDPATHDADVGIHCLVVGAGRWF